MKTTNLAEGRTIYFSLLRISVVGLALVLFFLTASLVVGSQ